MAGTGTTNSWAGFPPCHRENCHLYRERYPVGQRYPDRQIPNWSQPRSVVFHRRHSLPEGRRPHVLINCPENAGCTAFANTLCEMLGAKACRIDSREDAPRWDIGENTTFVHKGAINGHHLAQGCDDADCFAQSSLNTMATQLAPPQHFTHRLLLFKDPVQNYLSLVHKPWCDNDGGFAAKWQAVDLSFQAHYVWRLSPFYDAVLFEDWMDRATLVSLLGELGLRKHLVSTAAPNTDANQAVPGNIWREKAEQLGLDVTGWLNGNLGSKLSPRKSHAPYPEACHAVKAAARYTPILFEHYHAARARVLVNEPEPGWTESNMSDALRCDSQSIVPMLKAHGACPTYGTSACRMYCE